MDYTAQKMITPRNSVLLVVGTTISVLSFILIYQSGWMIDILETGDQHLTFNVLMMSSIVLVVLGITRTLMVFVSRKMYFTHTLYILCCIIEWILCSLYCGLYLTLMYHGQYGYFAVVGRCLYLLLSIMVFPYAIIHLALYLIDAMKPKIDASQSSDLIRFTDYTQRVKLVIAKDVFLYAQADENYIKIFYSEGEEIKSYSIRNTMLGIAPLMEQHQILRCQRSYYINPKHIKLLKREKDGATMAELDIDASKPVPISSKYYTQIAEIWQ